VLILTDLGTIVILAESSGFNVRIGPNLFKGSIHGLAFVGSRHNLVSRLAPEVSGIK
jgi:hypothetical protein